MRFQAFAVVFFSPPNELLCCILFRVLCIMWVDETNLVWYLDTVQSFIINTNIHGKVLTTGVMIGWDKGAAAS